jgi:WD40 repeat protein
VRAHGALLAAGKDVWLDEQGILPASSWAQDLKEAIEGADTFIAVISPEWVASVECRKELDHAATLSKRIIPLNLSATAFEQLPEMLRAQQFVPARGGFEDDFEGSMRSLIVAIETDADWLREHTGWAKKAFEWEEHGRDRSFLLSGSELAASEQYLAHATGRDPEPGQRQNDFVLASREGATRRQRRLLGGVSVALVVALVLGGLALLQWRQAVSNERTAQSRQVAAESETALTSDPELSVLLALQALRTHPTTQAEAALRDALPQLQVLRTLHGATTMQSAAFSPHGSNVITSDLAGNLVIWDGSTGRRLRELRDPQGKSIVTVAYNDSGTEFVTASLDGADGAATIWNASTGRPVRQLLEPAGATSSTASFSPEINDASFSPNGTEVVTAGGNAARIWSVATGKVLEVLQSSGTTSAMSTAVFNPDGTEVVTTDGSTAQIWNLATGQPLVTISEPDELNDAEFSPDGSQILTASADGTARIWSASTGAQQVEMPEPGAAVLNRASFSPDGKEVVTASNDGTATVWDAATGAPALVLRGHRGAVFSAAFSPNGKEIITASEDGTAKIWDAQAVGTRRVLTATTGSALYAVGVNRSGTEVVAAGDDGTYIWDTATGHLAYHLAGSAAGGPNGAAFSPNGKEIITASDEDGTAKEWSAVTGKELLTLQDPSGTSIYSASFSPNGKEIITASEDRTARIWSAATGRQLRVITEPGGVLGVLFSAVFSANDRQVVTASLDGTARIWSAASGKQLQEMAEPGLASIISAAFSPDGKEVVTASVDGSARIWSVATGKQLEVLAEPGGAAVYSAAFSPNGSEVVTSSADGTARIWSAATGQPLTVFKTGSEARDSVFTAGGTEIVTATFGGTSIIWSSQLAGPLGTLVRLAEHRVTGQLTAAERRAYL